MTAPSTPPNQIYTGWREQYDRMLRSYELLRRVYLGNDHFGTAVADDAMIHFFQDAFHLKDWIKNDPATTANSEAAVKGCAPLEVCADLANGSKHFELKGTGRQDAHPTARNIEVSITDSITPNVHVVNRPPRTKHAYVITSATATYDALDLANDVVAAWEAWLTSEGLL